MSDEQDLSVDLADHTREVLAVAAA